MTIITRGHVHRCLDNRRISTSSSCFFGSTKAKRTAAGCQVMHRCAPKDFRLMRKSNRPSRGTLHRSRRAIKKEMTISRVHITTVCKARCIDSKRTKAYCGWPSTGTPVPRTSSTSRLALRIAISALVGRIWIMTFSRVYALCNSSTAALSCFFL